jgi:hypothetical protein
MRDDPRTIAPPVYNARKKQTNYDSYWTLCPELQLGYINHIHNYHTVVSHTHTRTRKFRRWTSNAQDQESKLTGKTRNRECGIFRVPFIFSFFHFFFFLNLKNATIEHLVAMRRTAHNEMLISTIHQYRALLRIRRPC